MTLSWEEYQKTVPKETLDFTKDLILFCNNNKYVAENVRCFSESTIRFLEVAVVAYNKTLDMRKILLEN